MESDSEAAESELGEAVSVQGNLKFGKKGNIRTMKFTIISTLVCPTGPRFQAYAISCARLLLQVEIPQMKILCVEMQQSFILPNTKEEKSSYVTSTVLLQVDLGGKLDFIFFSGSKVLKLNMQQTIQISRFLFTKNLKNSGWDANGTHVFWALN